MIPPFDSPIPPYQRHSTTSHRASQQVRHSTGNLRAKVLEYLRRCKQRGATDEEIQLATGLNPSTQRPRRVELVASHDVWDSGLKRKTTSGRKAVVWVAV